MSSKTKRPGEHVYLSPARFTLLLRGARRGRLRFDANTAFVILFTLGGSLRWSSAGDGASGLAGAEADGGETREGDALLLSPGTPFDATVSGRAEYLLLSLAPAAVLDCAARARLMRDESAITFRERAVRDARLFRVALDMAEELREDSPGREAIIESLVEQTLVQALRRYANVRRDAGLELSRAGLIDRRVRRAVELMHAQLGRELKLEELAASAHLSPFHFARLFKKLTARRRTPTSPRFAPRARRHYWPRQTSPSRRSPRASATPAPPLLQSLRAALVPLAQRLPQSPRPPLSRQRIRKTFSPGETIFSRKTTRALAFNPRPRFRLQRREPPRVFRAKSFGIRQPSP
jgi:AraC family transcriptional regulator